jgi:predicted DCC family thiol-disulfide oxidoreductase YuxK
VPQPTLVFDGDCGFCTRSAEVARRILPAGVAVTAWQFADLAALGTTAERAQREVLWMGADGRVSGGATAVSRALGAAGGVWASLGWLLAVPPVSWLARGVYRVVAANRMRLPGGTPACAAPRELPPSAAV